MPKKTIIHKLTVVLPLMAMFFGAIVYLRPSIQELIDTYFKEKEYYYLGRISNSIDNRGNVDILSSWGRSQINIRPSIEVANESLINASIRLVGQLVINTSTDGTPMHGRERPTTSSPVKSRLGVGQCIRVLEVHFRPYQTFGERTVRFEPKRNDFWGLPATAMRDDPPRTLTTRFLQDLPDCIKGNYSCDREELRQPSGSGVAVWGYAVKVSC